MPSEPAAPTLISSADARRRPAVAAAPVACVSANAESPKAADARTHRTREAAPPLRGRRDFARTARSCRPRDRRARAIRSLMRCSGVPDPVTRIPCSGASNSLLIFPVPPLPAPSGPAARCIFLHQINDLWTGLQSDAGAGAEFLFSGITVSRTRRSPGCTNHLAGARTALTRQLSCVYSALFRRVDVARRVLSCLPAFWDRSLPIPQGMAVRSKPGGLNRVSS